MQQSSSYLEVNIRGSIGALLLLALVVAGCGDDGGASSRFGTKDTTTDPLPTQVKTEDSRRALVQALETSYSGKISTQTKGPEASQCIAAVARLLREWNPVGFTCDDVKTIMGSATREDEDTLDYIFDNGLDGAHWRFTHADGTVTGIEYIPMD